MAEWFECKVKFDKTVESGQIKTVTEAYLVDALSFTEAEKRFIDEIKPFMSGEFFVQDIKRARIAELVESIDATDDRWYKAKVVFITLDEKTAVEKKTAQTQMIQAKDFATALAHLQRSMEGTLGDWTIASIQETAIMDVFRYKPQD
ncbi:MAG: DUF4494 domain-containing protein [Bacteroidaceae bacterium]|nr:DUF4494 domain-containing protein [Bacteroidaceae bacterium]